MQRVAVVLALVAVFIYLNNTSLLTKSGGSGPFLIAHRGLGQQYNRSNLTSETCTAAQTILTGHDYLENTIPSMQAAFDYGAHAVEFDVHRTTDNRFAVFHDWTLDCRTNGSGVTHEQFFDSLKTLDIGYGYTADGGQTYPFRGQGVGMMPSLADVLSAFPHQQLVIDLKSQAPTDGALLADRLTALPSERQEQIMLYGGGGAVSIVRERMPRIRTIWPRRLRQCLIRYFAIGWSGYVPEVCKQSMVMVPANYAPWLWGWPHRFTRRMEAAGSQVIVIGDHHGESYSNAFDDLTRLNEIPADFSGGIWTDRIDLFGPAIEGSTEAVPWDAESP